MKRYLKIACCNWVNASHDKRELSVARELGAETMVMAKGTPSDKGRIDNVDGFTVYRYSVRPFGDTSILRALNRVVSVFIWVKQARKLRPDIISGHDVIGLLIGYLASLGMGKNARPALIYDSHEYEIGRNYKRSKVQLLFVKMLEKYLMKKATVSLVVADSIADELTKMYQLKCRPTVVRNIANYWIKDEDRVSITRQKLCSELGIDEKAWLMMYHGAVMQGRGIENIIDALSRVDDVYLIVLGNGKADYIEELRSKCVEKHIEQRVLFHSAVDYATLPSYVGAIDVGVVTITAPSKSYYYALPNKFFEYIQAGVPMICSDFPEMSKIVNEYDNAALVDPYSVDEIARSIVTMKDDKEVYEKFKKNTIAAKEELCWENEKRKLEDVLLPIIVG